MQTGRSPQEASAQLQRLQLEAEQLEDQARNELIAGELEAAQVLARRAVEKNASYGPAQHLLGLIYFKQGDLYRAATHLDMAARLMDDRFEPCYNLGQVLEAGGQYEQAMQYYRKALSRQVDHLETLANLARVRIKAGYRDYETLRLLNRCLERERRPEWSAWIRQEVMRLEARLGYQPSLASDRPDQSGARGPMGRSEDQTMAVSGQGDASASAGD